MKSFGMALIAVGVLAGCGGNESSPTPKAQLTASQSKQSADTGKGTKAADYELAVQSLYIAYFGRPADPGGLANFEAALLAAGARTDVPGLNADYSSIPAVKTLVDSFGTSDESIALYGTGNNTAFISAIYKNILGRTPPANDEGLAFWVGAVNSGNLSRGNAALSIAAGALGNQTAQGKLDAQLITNRVTVATYFTGQLTAQNLASTYAGNTAAANARAMLGEVTASTNTATFVQTSAMAAAWPNIVVPGLFQGITTLSKNTSSTGVVLQDGVLGRGAFQMFVLPGGTTWMLYGTSEVNDGLTKLGTIAPGGGFAATGIAMGNIAPYDDDNFYGSMTQFSAPGDVGVAMKSTGFGEPLKDGVTHWYNGYLGNLPPVTVSTSTYGTGTYPVIYAHTAGPTSYTFNTTASLSSIATTWSGKLLDGATANVTIAANGAISGTSSLGCTMAGTATPSADGKNYFNVSITYGGAPCVAANQTETGIAYMYGLHSSWTTKIYDSTIPVTGNFTLTYAPLSGKSELIIVTTNTAKTRATAFYAQR